ncbi:MAG TPA: HAMP domain-containing protein, partial [Marinobacter salarius]
MRWFQNLSVRLKILAVAVLGIVLFLAYFLYSYYIAATNIDHLSRIENHDFPVLELVNANNLEFVGIADAYSTAIAQIDERPLDEARVRSDQFLERLGDIDRLDPALTDDVDRIRMSFIDYLNEANGLAQALIEDPMTLVNSYAWLDRVELLERQLKQVQDEFQAKRYEAFRDTLLRSREDNRSTQMIGLALGVMAFTLLGWIALRVTRSITRPLEDAVGAADSIANGNWDTAIQSESRDETGHLIRAIRKMRDTIKHRIEDEKRQEQIKTRLSQLGDLMRGDMAIDKLGSNLLGYVIPTLNAQIGAFYTFDVERERLYMRA